MKKQPCAGDRETIRKFSYPAARLTFPIRVVQLNLLLDKHIHKNPAIAPEEKSTPKLETEFSCP
jgi:hypothetical protein